MKNVAKKVNSIKYTLMSKIIELNNVGDNGVFQINKYKLHCFIPDFTTYGFAESWGKYKGNNFRNKTFETYLQLSPRDLKLANNSKAQITQLDGFHYQIIGKIIKKLNNNMPDEKFVVECKIPIIIPTPNKPEYKKYKIGEMIFAEGRLDAYLVNNKQFAEGKDET